MIILWRLSTMHERDRQTDGQTDKPRNGNINTNSLQATSLSAMSSITRKLCCHKETARCRSYLFVFTRDSIYAIARIIIMLSPVRLSVTRVDHTTRSQAVPKIADRTAVVGVTWPRQRPLSGELFVRPLGIPHTKLHTKFEISSPSIFRDIAL